MFDNKVVHLALDDQNRLYIHYGLPGWQYAFNGRIDVMDLKTQKIEPLSKTIPQLPFNEKDICKIISDKTGKLYFIVANPFRCFSYSSGNGFRLICEMNKWKNVKHNINEF